MARSHLLSKVDALAQCRNPKCRRIWSYDGVDAVMDMRNGVHLECPGCGQKVSLYQNLESLFV